MDSKILVFSLFLLILIPNVSALDAVPGYSTECLNSTTLTKIANITDRQDGTKILDSIQYVTCPYGCDQFNDICWKWNGNAISGEYFLLFQIIALIIFFFAAWRLEEDSSKIKLFDVVIPLFGMILFILLALQGNNVIDMSTGESIPVTMLVWLDYGLFFLMLIFFFFNVFKWMKSVAEEGAKL